MQYRTFADTGFQCSEVGLGTWQYGGDWGAIDERMAREILATAVDDGVSFIDTADVYGLGVSEDIIGNFHRGRSETLFVATKLGRFPKPGWPDNFSFETTFTDQDHRSYNRDGAAFNVGETFAGLPFRKGVELADALRPALSSDAAMATCALRWILDHDAVSTVIPGASNPGQVLGNNAASNLAPLSAAQHRWIAEYYDRDVAPHIRGPC